MATGNTVTRNTEKYCRLAILTAKGCTEILRALVLHQMKLSTPAGTDWTVDDFVNNVFTQDNKRKLSDKQHRILFPRGGRSTDIKKWDLSLLAILLLDVCKNVDIHVKMDVKKMKDIRNKVCHAEDAFTEDAEFTMYFDQLKICIKRCLAILGDDDFENEMRALVRDIEHSAISMDESVRILHEWYKNDKRNEEQLERIEQDLQTIKSSTVKTNEKMDEMFSMIKQLIQRHPDPDSIGIPDTPLDVDVKNCAAVEERKLSQILVDILNSKSENDPKLKKYVSDPEFEKILDAVNELKDHMLSGGRTITNAYEKCVILNIHCPNFDNFKDLVFQCSSGYINAMFRPVEEAIRRMEGFEEVSLEAAISDEAFWTNMSTIVENILAAYGYSLDNPEAEPMDNTRPESDDPSDVIQGAELLPPDGTHDGTRIRINIKPRSMKHHDHIVDTVTSGSIRSTLEKLAVTMREYYHLDDLNIEAKLAELNTPSIEENIAALNNLNMQEDIAVPNTLSIGANIAGPNTLSMASKIEETTILMMKTQLSGTNKLSMKTQLEEPTSPSPVREIQEYLISQYKRDAFAIPKCPILRTHGLNVDDIYVQLPIVHRPDTTEYEYDGTRRVPATVETYKDVLFDEQTVCKNVYVVGKAGMGKTTWCKQFVATWVKAKENMGKQWVPDVNESFLREYDLVLYIDLQQASTGSDVIEMIKHQLYPNRQDLLVTTESLLNDAETSSRCIIILDGLDHWSVPRQDVSSDGIPVRDPTWQCSIITTTDVINEELQLEKPRIDKVAEMQRLEEDCATKLIDHIISVLNKQTGQCKISSDFRSQISIDMKSIMEVPLLLTMFVCLWYDRDQLSTHLTGAYSDLMEMLIRCSESDSKRPFQNIPAEKLVEMKRDWNTENTSTPECLSDRHVLVTYLPFLLRLGKLAFNTLYPQNMEPTLVFDDHTIKPSLSDEEIKLSENLGILYRTTHKDLKLQESGLTFLHKTIQEYLATLYMVSINNKSECLITLKMYCNDVNGVQEMENMLVFLSGLSPELAGVMSCYISEMDPDERIHHILMRCWKESLAATSKSTPIYIKHHWWYSKCVHNEDTLCYLGLVQDKTTTLYLTDGSALSPEVGVYCPELLDLTRCQSLKTLHYQMSSVEILVPNSLEEVFINGYKGPKQCVLDLSGCRSLSKLRYQNSNVWILVPNNLVEVDIDMCIDSLQFTLDLSWCQSLRKLRYKSSDPQIIVPNNVEEVDVYGYSKQSIMAARFYGHKAPNNLKGVDTHVYTGPLKEDLDLSKCQSLRKLQYKCSNALLRVPNSLVELDIYEYRGYTESVLDLSGCQSLRKLGYKKSDARIVIPNNVEELDVWEYNGLSKSVMDLSECQSLNFLQYTHCDVPILLPNNVIAIYIYGYTGPSNSVLDLSVCQTLKCLRYHNSDARIRTTDSLEELDIEQYTGPSEWVLDLSGCQSLRRLRCECTNILLRVPNGLVELDINDLKRSMDSVFDLSGCQSLSKLRYYRSNVQILVPDNLEEVDINTYIIPTAPELDLSRCQSLKKLQYVHSNVVLLVPDSLEEVAVESYIGSREWVLDLSQCHSLRKLHKCNSSIRILVPDTLGSTKRPADPLHKFRESCGLRTDDAWPSGPSESESLTSPYLKSSTTPNSEDSGLKTDDAWPSGPSESDRSTSSDSGSSSTCV